MRPLRIDSGMARSGFIIYPAFDKLRPNGRKTVRGDAEPVEASNREPEVMKLLLGISCARLLARPRQALLAPGPAPRRVRLPLIGGNS
jgi:hypothetical protein